MWKRTAILVLLLQDSESFKITSKNKEKHAFIQKLQKAQRKHGEKPMTIPNSRLVKGSVHKPGLRAAPQDAAPQDAAKTPMESETKVLGQDARKLRNWWNWWSNSGEEAAEGEEQEAEEEAVDNARNDTSWWSWNGGWGNQDTGDDMWADGDNETYVADSLADFSVKYAGCQSLTSFLDDEDGADPYYNQNFITYRLCPTESCQDDSWQGCKSSYGEYMMSLEDFLMIQQDFIKEQMEYYCKFCYNCLTYDAYMNGNYNDENENQEEHSCYLYDECSEGFEQMCDEDGEVDENGQEDAEFAAYNLEDFFTCEQVDLTNMGNNDNGDDGAQSKIQYDDKFMFDDAYDIIMENGGAAYIGTHCVGGRIGVGIFSDEYCTHYVGNQMQSFYNETEDLLDISAIEEIYVPDGCLSCDQDNIEQSNYWLPENNRENEEHEEMYENGEYVSEICYNMYEYSAKCHANFGEDEMALELSDNELAVQELTCDYIEDIMKGNVDEDGFVNSHQQGTLVTDFFGSFGADDLEENATGGQIAGLIFTGLAAAGMGYLAYEMKKKVDSIPQEGLIANDAGVST